MQSKPNVYIENSVVSYLAARPSRNLVTAAWQRITADWWLARRNDFNLYISELVVAEAERGDPEAAAERLKYLQGIPEVPITREVRDLAEALVSEGALPAKAVADAFHIAAAAVNGIEYLLTWNCRHIDNAELKPLVRSVCAIHGYQCPETCTPQELMGEEDEGG